MNFKENVHGRRHGDKDLQQLPQLECSSRNLRRHGIRRVSPLPSPDSLRSPGQPSGGVVHCSRTRNRKAPAGCECFSCEEKRKKKKIVLEKYSSAKYNAAGVARLRVAWFAIDGKNCHCQRALRQRGSRAKGLSITVEEASRDTWTHVLLMKLGHRCFAQMEEKKNKKTHRRRTGYFCMRQKKRHSRKHPRISESVFRKRENPPTGSVKIPRNYAAESLESRTPREQRT